MLATPPSKDDLIDLEASPVDYLATVDINYKVVTESGIEEFDDVVATVRSNHEQMIASLRLSEPEESFRERLEAWPNYKRFSL